MKVVILTGYLGKREGADQTACIVGDSYKQEGGRNVCVVMADSSGQYKNITVKLLPVFYFTAGRHLNQKTGCLQDFSAIENLATFEC